MYYTALLLTALAALAAAQLKKTNHIVTINRDEAEYLKDTPCPITHVEITRDALRERVSQGFKVCKEANIADCPKDTTFYLDERQLNKCQKCTCNTPEGDHYKAHCNKVDCATLPGSTPLPGKGVLTGGARQNCFRSKPKVCKENCSYMARDRRCVYCDCTNKVDFNLPEYQFNGEQ